MEYIPVEKKTVGFLPKRGNLSKAFSLEVRYHSNTNIQRYVNHNMKNTRTPRRCPCFFWALPLLLTLYLPEILVKGFFFKILSPTFAISLKHGYIYSKKYSFEVFSQTMPPLFHFFPKTRWLTPDRPYIGWSGLPLLTRCSSLLLVCASIWFLLCFRHEICQKDLHDQICVSKILQRVYKDKEHGWLVLNEDELQDGHSQVEIAGPGPWTAASQKSCWK